MSTKHPTIKSFSYAISGLKLAFKEEPNFKIHLGLGLLSILMGLYFKLDPTQMTILILVINTVIVLELINTMLEALVDLVSPQITNLAKIAKDVSAGAVLISAISATVIGLILFLPKIF